jgi:hypothetical protein
MKSKLLLPFILAFVAVIILLTTGLAWARHTSNAPSYPQDALGNGFTYQGYLTDGGVPAQGEYDFEFVLYDTGVDGTLIDTEWVDDVWVEDGTFTTQIEFVPGVFDGNRRWLAIGVRPGDDTGAYTPLAERQPITPAPYALYAVEADTVDGLHASELGTHYQNVVAVAKSGGDYTSIQAGIDSITDASVDNPYLVWIAPGVYSEMVTMKPYVHLQGAGQEVTILTSTITSSTWPPSQATLVLASDTSLRDMTVGNIGEDAHNVAILATAGMTRTLVEDVTARAQGEGDHNYAFLINGPDTEVTLRSVAALSENSSLYNYGLYNLNGASTSLQGGSITSRRGSYCYGIQNIDPGTFLETFNVEVLCENGSDANMGLINNNGAEALLKGGSFIARGGNTALGIGSSFTETILTAENIFSLGENGSMANTGISTDSSAVTTLHGGSFIGRGGTYTHGSDVSYSATLNAEMVNSLGENGSSGNIGLYTMGGSETNLIGGTFTGLGGDHAHGIYCFGNGTILETENIIALGENGSNGNHGLYAAESALVTLHGGTFTGLGGNDTYGIYNNQNKTLITEGITALGENGSSGNHGLYTEQSVLVMLYGGTFTGRGGIYTYGINHWDATLIADGVIALGENGSGSNIGLDNNLTDSVTLRNSSFIGQGGTSAYGIRTLGMTFKAEFITALGENGSSNNYGFYHTDSVSTNIHQSILGGVTNSIRSEYGYFTVSNSRLIGGSVYTDTGDVTCVLVTRGTNVSTDGSTCP